MRLTRRSQRNAEAGFLKDPQVALISAAGLRFPEFVSSRFKIL